MADPLSPQQRAFLEANHSAVMATVDNRGRPHAVPVLCALVDGQSRTTCGCTGRPPAAPPTTWRSTGRPWSPSAAWFIS